MRAIDNTLTGGRVASTIGIPVPFLGSLDIIDGFMLAVLTQGGKNIRKGIIPFLIAKVEQGTLPLLPSLNLLPVGGSPTGSPASGVQSTGAGF